MDTKLTSEFLLRLLSVYTQTLERGLFYNNISQKFSCMLVYCSILVTGVTPHYISIKIK